jgi:hypothetical protein
MLLIGSGGLVGGTETSMDADDPLADGEYADFDVSKPNVARVYDAMLGGKDNISQEVRADFRNRVRTFVIAGQTPLLEKLLTLRSCIFMYHYIP